MEKYTAQRDLACFHEAGHAVVAMTTNVVAYNAVVGPDSGDADSQTGRTCTGPAWSAEAVAARRRRQLLPAPGTRKYEVMRACYVLDTTYCVAGAVAECRISHDSRSACFWGLDDWDAMKSTLGLNGAVDRRETAVLEAIERDAYDLAELIIDRQWRAVCYVTAWLRKNRFVGDADMAPCFQRYMVYPVADPVHELMLSAARGIGLPRPWPGIRTVGSEAFLMPDFSVEAFAQRAIDRKNDTHLRGGFGELPSSDEVNEVVIEWLSANREQPPRRESRGSARPTAH